MQYTNDVNFTQIGSMNIEKTAAKIAPVTQRKNSLFFRKPKV